MGEPVDVNFASEEELREVEGIGREYAAPIIAARTQHDVLTPAVLDTLSDPFPKGWWKRQIDAGKLVVSAST
jgi:hypothetical protein